MQIRRKLQIHKNTLHLRLEKTEKILKVLVDKKK